VLFGFATDARTPGELGDDALLRDAVELYYTYLVHGWTCP
jgi:hypothetical protein